ncbi:MAG: outer membrane beta-barrel protein [Sulfurimonadaceae bacterium]
MMRFFILFLAFVGLACADRDGGPYLGIGYGVSEFGTNDIYTDLKEDKANSFMIYGGAAINKHLSVELGYVGFGSYILANDTELEANIITVTTLVQYPFYEDMFSIYAKVGVGQVDLSTLNDTGFSYVAGGGLSYRYNEYLGVKAGYEYYPFDYEDTLGATHSMKIEYVYGAFEVQF